jgi:hypothetical protein
MLELTGFITIITDFDERFLDLTRWKQKKSAYEKPSVAIG